jgi:hypothetical protein
MGSLSFAKMVNDLDNHMQKQRSDCFDYGIWHGCDCKCPVFLSGKCDIGDVDAFTKMVEGLSDDEKEEIYSMYPQLRESIK